MDNILDKYNSLIEENPKKASNYLALMFGEMFNKQVTGSTFGMFSKLVKLYGIDRVKYSLLDIYDMDNANLKNPYPLLVYFIKKRMEVKTSDYSNSLVEFVGKQKELLGKNKLTERRSLDSE